MSNFNMNQSWGTLPQFTQGQHIQLEEEFYSQGSQAHPHHVPLHTASYPLPASQRYQQPPNLSPTAVQRSQSYGSNPNGNFNYNNGGPYRPAMSQAGHAPFLHSPGSATGFLAQPPYGQLYPKVSTSSLHGSGMAPPNHNNAGNRNNGGITPPFTTSPMSTPLTFGSQPLPMPGQDTYQQPTYMFPDAPQSGSASPVGKTEQDPPPQPKKSRKLDDEDESMDVGMEHEDAEGQDVKDSKSKPGGACARCKNLKVKCEFRTAEDPCKRCMNAGKECVIPGRKKRRTPPKREHLLAQIRDQATQIQKLMAQLESTKSHPRISTVSIRRSSPGVDLLSPLDPSSPNSATSKPDVEEWIAKARESIEAFGGFIGAGGAGMTQGFLVAKDPEDSSSSGDDAYEFAVEDEDGDTFEIDELPDRDGLVHKRRSTSRDKESVGSGTKSLSGTGTQKLVTLPTGGSPFGLIANLSLKHRRRRSSPGIEEEDDIGVANDEYFKPSPTPDPERIRTPTESRTAPHILARGVITPDEAEKLFRIYFDNMNLSCSLLDPFLYTAQKTCYRSPFLFTVVCAIASRFYTEKPELYHDLIHYAQLAAGTALISGQKSIEVCQAYILLSLYPVPARRWEDHRSWLYLGLAIRVAGDLNLHLPNTAKPLNEQHAREMMNRTRVWMNCFNLDRSTGSQYGKSPIIPNSDYIANHSENWWKSSEFNLKNFDIQLCGYNAELKVMAKFGARIYSDPNHPTGLNKNVDFEKIAFETDDELKSLGNHWFGLLEQTDQTDTQNRFRTGLLRIAFSYARLIALALAFQHAFGKTGADETMLVTRCLSAASDIANIYVNDVGRPAQRVYIRHGPEAQCVFVTFAASFLVKLLHHKYSAYLSKEKRLEIRGLVQTVADLLGSSEIAIDDRHSPKLYSRFLTGLLATPMASVESLFPAGTTASSFPHRRPGRRATSGSGRTPESDRSFDLNPHHLTSPVSPSNSASAHAHAPPFGTPVTPLTHLSSPNTPALHTTDLNLNDWLPTPLSFDSELVRSMQSVQDSVWGQDVTVPGFNWMSNMQPNDRDFGMPGHDSGNMFTQNFFDTKTPPP